MPGPARAAKPIRALQVRPDEEGSLTRFGLLTAKPILYVANVAEPTSLGKASCEAVREFAEKAAPVVPVCAKLEAELAELDEADRDEML